ncbi:fungal specific transcription factor domain-containing protein [Aspergillus melleus]|uniref:fungal specific transcription factor domain-containing protein n=1 Tax=Aspergillus melleus TaxID=138277 RepID=UPI001E8DE639|nr:uncharacterized protein LDX57_001175 [Aspergillus melleus]KAH8423414.1 hypothetical protein LDX57_001175 [Aspergillus melleus]
MQCPEIPVNDANEPFFTVTEPSVESSAILPTLPISQPAQNFGDFSLFIDSMSMPYTDNLSTLLLDHQILPLSPSPLFTSLENQGSHNECRELGTSAQPIVPMADPSAPHLYDEFSSTFPSFETSSSISKRESWDITQEGWNSIYAEIQNYISLLPLGFSLPSRHTMTRYIATYFSGFHRHLPFLHIPTFSPVKVQFDLILAMAAIGAQSSFDNDTAVMLFKTSHAVVLERLRHRKAELCVKTFAEDGSLAVPQYIAEHETNHPISNLRPLPGKFKSLPAAQTLLLLMAMATWGNSKAIYNESVGLQNALTSLVRDEGFLEMQTQTTQEMNWSQWIHVEGFKRTLAIIFCFFIFHTIVYDTPPPILNSELDIYLPSHEANWAARSEKKWDELRRESGPESNFQRSFSLLFSKNSDEGNGDTEGYSSLGGYTLILAIIQHIYLLRAMTKSEPGSDRSLPSTDVADVEQALRNWQKGWYLDPESSFGPGSPQGPISFNSTALLRMAYIRLNVDVGPWRSLNTHDPLKIARSIHQSPPLRPSHKLTRAVLYSAHALSIPVKIGVNIVARNQAFTWSLQHSLCALECAFVLSKWLAAVQDRTPGTPLDEDETRLLAYISDMMQEADPGFRPMDNAGRMPHGPDLSARVIKTWAKLLSGDAVWDVVRMIGKALEAYGRILENGSAL